MSNEEYTPTADEMRNAYASYCQETYNQTYDSASAEFDRFIETVRASEYFDEEEEDYEIPIVYLNEGD